MGHARSIAVVLALGVLAALAVSCGDEPDPAVYCDAARTAAAVDLSQLFAAFDPSAPGASQADLEAGVDTLRDLRDAASGDMRDDLSTLVDMAGDVVDALGDLEADPSGTRDRIAALAEEYPDADAASQRVLAGTTEQCGVNLQSAVG